MREAINLPPLTVAIDLIVDSTTFIIVPIMNSVNIDMSINSFFLLDVYSIALIITIVNSF